MVMDGAEFNTDNSREKYAYVTKFRVLTRDFSKIGDNFVVETEEVAVSTKDLSLKIICKESSHPYLLNNPGLSIKCGQK